MIEQLKIIRSSFNQHKKTKKGDRKVFWTSSNTGIPAIYYFAFDIIPFYPQLMMYNMDEFLKNAEVVEGKFEIPNDICTDNKIALARCLSPETSSTDIPEPDFTVSTNLFCNQVVGSFDFIGRHKGVPNYSLEVPLIKHKKISNDKAYEERINQFLIKQFDTLTASLEEKLGKKLDEEKFRTGIDTYFKVSLLIEHILKLNTIAPSAIDGQDFWGLCMPIFVTNYLDGKTDILDFYVKLYNYAYEENEKNRAQSAEREKIRIYWDGQIFIKKIKLIKEILANHGASVVCGSHLIQYLDMNEIWEDSLPYPLTKEKYEEIYKEKNYLKKSFRIENIESLSVSELMAKALLKMSCYKQGVQYRQDVLKTAIEKFDIDAVIINMSQSCRAWSSTQTHFMNYIEKELGIPNLMIQADTFDERCISEAQIITRIESFLENIPTGN